MTGYMEHWHYDTFQARMRDHQMGKAFVTFSLNAEGAIDEVKLSVPNLGDFPFKRAAAKSEAVAGITLSEADLKKFVGKYELKVPPLELSVEMIGGKLKASLPGQPVATLVPLTPTRFKVEVEGAPFDIFAEFTLADGKPQSMTLEQGKQPKLLFFAKP